MTSARPPRLAAWLLATIVASDDREHVLGDFHEEYLAMTAARGRGAAARWYWAELARALGPALRRRGEGMRSAVADLGRETRQSVRLLGRRPGLTLSASLTLALGIGLTTAIFSVLHAVLLKPSPYPEGDRLVQVWNTYPGWRGHEILDAYWDRVELAYPEYRSWRAGQTSFEEVAIFGTTRMTLTGLPTPDGVLVGSASVSLLPLLGVQPSMGRGLAAEEEGPGAPRVALISDGEWRGRFGSDARIIGRMIELDGIPYTIIGVLPRGFHLRPMAVPGAEPHAVWIPIGALGEELDAGNHRYDALGRLRPDVTLEGARKEAERVLSEGTRPGSRGARALYRRDAETGSARPPLLLLFGAVCVLMLIACGNVAMLLLGEAAGRSRELATRSAIGAGRWRIVRQLLVESTVLSLLGVCGGVLVAAWSVRLLPRLAPDGLPMSDSVVLDPVVLGFAVALGLGTGVVFGLAPVAAAWGGHTFGDLRAAHGPPRGRTLQRSVLVGQVALSLVLLAGAGLLVRTVAALGAVAPGFEPRGLVTARLSFSPSRNSSEQATRLHLEIVDALRGRAGVDRVTMTSAMPFSGGGGSSSFQIVGREVGPDEKKPEANRRTVLPGYHEAVGIPLVAGRHLTAADRDAEAPVIVVSESLAARYWPDGNVLGRRITRDRRNWEIVGVVGDVRHEHLATAPKPTFYVPFEVAESRHDMTLVVASALPTHEIAGLLRATVAAVDSDVPVEDIATAESLIARSTRAERFRSVLLAAFALTATVLSAVGLFGVTTRLVTARRRELGIRVALGAHRARLVRGLVVAEGRFLAVGILLGLAGAVLAGRALTAFLFGVAPSDPLSIGGGAGVLLITGLAACWRAARRGTAADPVEAIRAE